MRIGRTCRSKIACTSHQESLSIHANFLLCNDGMMAEFLT